MCQGTIIQHWLNGKKVVDFDYADPKWAANVQLLQQLNGDLTKRNGHLHLQDHGDPVWFRGIKLRKLKPDEQLDDKPIEPAKIPATCTEARARDRPMVSLTKPISQLQTGIH